MEVTLSPSIVISVNYLHENCLRFCHVLLEHCPFVTMQDHSETSKVVSVPIGDLTPVQVAQILGFSFEHGYVERVAINLGACAGQYFIVTREDVRLLHNGQDEHPSLIHMRRFSDHYSEMGALSNELLSLGEDENAWVNKPFRWFEFFAVLAFQRSYKLHHALKDTQQKLVASEERASDLAAQRNRYLRILRRVKADVTNVPEAVEGEVVAAV